MTPESLSEMTFQAKPRSSRFGRVLAFRRLFVTAAGVLLLLSMGSAIAQDSTLIVLRPMPAKVKKGQKHIPLITTPIVQSDVAEIRIGGQPVTITSWSPVLKGDFKLQLMVLLDSMEQLGINEQFDDMRKLFNGLPPNVSIGVGYLLQGHVRIVQDFTYDRKLAGDALVEPKDTTESKNDNGSPYACLKDLANHWPEPDPKTLRAVLMFTDGINRYNSFQGIDQDDPDVLSTAALLVRAGIMPFPFYYMDPVTPQNRSEGGPLDGQTNFDLLASTTEGQALYEGQYAPATFDPLLNRFYSVLNSMAVATVTTKGSGYKTIDVKSSREDIGVGAPDGVTLGNGLKTSPQKKK
jgi:hypothetical protein